MKNEIIEMKREVLNAVQNTEDENVIGFLYGYFLGHKSPIERTLIQLRGDKTKEEVAKACEISLSALTTYENGERVPRDEVKHRLCEYYGLTNYYKQIKNAAPADQSINSCI